MIRLGILFFLSASFLFSHEKQAPSRLFAPQERSAFLPQLPKVNLMTGEYCEEVCDLVVAGAEPLSLRRFYAHFSGASEKIYGHWRVNPETLMLFNFEGEGHPFVGMGERTNAFLIYDSQIGNQFVFDLSKLTGLMATSGKQHPLNRSVTWKKGEVARCLNKFYEIEPHCWWEGVLKEGDGRERRFKTDVRYWPQWGKAPPPATGAAIPDRESCKLTI